MTDTAMQVRSGAMRGMSLGSGHAQEAKTDCWHAHFFFDFVARQLKLQLWSNAPFDV